jgi:hypothetical protein
LVNPNGIVNNTWFFNADGDISNMFLQPSVVNIKIARGQGSGKTNGKVWLRLNITNLSSTTSVQTNPAPFWLSLLQFQTPGGDVIQQRYPWDLWFAIIGTTSDDEWISMSDLILASNNYESGAPITPLATVDVWLPIIGNPYSCGEVATNQLEGDSLCILNTRDPTLFIESGPTDSLRVNQCALVFEMQQLDQSLLGALNAEYRDFPHSFYYPWVRNQDFTGTWNTNQQYTLQLSGISGPTAFIMLYLHSTGDAWDPYHGLPIQDFQFQNQEGVAISGSAFIPESYNRWAQLPRWFLGSWMQDRRYYGWNFVGKDSAPVEILSVGRAYSGYGMTGNEQLVVDMPGAGVNEIVTFTTSQGGTPQAGSYGFFTWVNEYGQIFDGPNFDMVTASAIGLKGYIESITGFEGQVTVSTPGGSPWGFTVTFIGNYGNRPLSSLGYSLKWTGVLQTTGGSSTTHVESLTGNTTTAGVRGITNGASYTLSVFAYSQGILSISSEKEGKAGRQKVQRSG